MPGYERDKQAMLARLRRIDDQVLGLQRVVEDDRCRIDVLTRVIAVRSALDNVAQAVQRLVRSR